MSIHNFSFNSFFSTNKNSYYEFINNHNNFENYDLDFSFIENKLIEKKINKKLFEAENNDYLFNDDSCITNHVLYNNAPKKNEDKLIKKKFISKREIQDKNSYNNKSIYRKDAYYKHFKSVFAKYVKDKENKLKNICFPHFNKNNFSALSYKYYIISKFFWNFVK